MAAPTLTSPSLKRPMFILSLDIGSGAVKAALLRVVVSKDDTEMISFERLVGREVVCHIGQSVIAQPQPTTLHGKRAIPLDAVKRLHAALQFVVAESSSVLRNLCILQKGAVDDDEFRAIWRTVPRVGIATAVFRETSNGPDVLDDLSRAFHCSLAVASQQLEGTIGYRTGCLALMERAKLQLPQACAELRAIAGSDIVVWDSGGASFQLTLEKRIGGGAQRQLAAYEGQWGSSKSTRAVVEDIQGRRIPADSANPMMMEHVTKSIVYFMSDLRRKESRDATHIHSSAASPEALCALSLTAAELRHAITTDAGLCSVVAIGGAMSAFRMASLLLRPCGSTRNSGGAAAAVRFTVPHLMMSSHPH
jgi:hypothetical protein